MFEASRGDDVHDEKRGDSSSSSSYSIASASLVELYVFVIILLPLTMVPWYHGTVLLILLRSTHSLCSSHSYQVLFFSEHPKQKDLKKMGCFFFLRHFSTRARNAVYSIH